MPDFPHLERAPITEAVLDLQVEAGPGVTADGIADSFGPAVRDLYPERDSVQVVAVASDATGVTTRPPSLIGYRWWTVDRKRAMQARIMGFAVNHVGDYNDWASLRNDAQKYWPKYVESSAPSRVTRCALRYINRIAVPVGKDVKSFLSTYPEVGSELPQLLDESFMRLVVPFGDSRYATIILATTPVASPTGRDLILDIDAFSARTFERAEFEAIWAEFDELRIIKNRCFFDSLKRETWEQYK